MFKGKRENGDKVHGKGGWVRGDMGKPAFYRMKDRAPVLGYLKAVRQRWASKFLTTSSPKMLAYISIHKFTINFTDVNYTKFTTIKYTIFFIVNSVWSIDSQNTFTNFCQTLISAGDNGCHSTVIWQMELHFNLFFFYINLLSLNLIDVKLFLKPHTIPSHKI